MGLQRITCLALLLASLMFVACQTDENPTPLTIPALRPEPVSLTDSDHDGLPDAVELHTENDRQNFRVWFTGIAGRQFYELSKEWNPEQRDCAGLVRFAWREALRKHDRAWLQKMGEGFRPLAPDIAAYSLDKNVLGEKLFRTRAGEFVPEDLQNGAFNEFADAGTLKQFNATYISHNVRQAQSGDLLFYFQPFTQKYPYHVMIYLGSLSGSQKPESDWVVYHTGGSAEDKGEVRQVRLALLARHPNPRWRPDQKNKNFLGFYRLNILR